MIKTTAATTRRRQQQQNTARRAQFAQWQKGVQTGAQRRSDGREAAGLGSTANNSKEQPSLGKVGREKRFKLRDKVRHFADRTLVTVADSFDPFTGEVRPGRNAPKDDKYLACGRRMREVGGTVGIHLTGGRAGVSGLMTCGSGWVCPVCSGKIQAHRAKELTRVLQWARGECYTLAMVTLTLRHSAEQSLEDVWDAVTLGWSSVTAGEGATGWASESEEKFKPRARAWRNAYIAASNGEGRYPKNGRKYQAARQEDMARAAAGGDFGELGPSEAGRWLPRRRIGAQERNGVIGWARAVEVTDGVNGWHVHVHAVVVLKGSPDVAHENAHRLGRDMFRRWEAGIKPKGFEAVALKDENGNPFGGLHISVAGGAEKRLAEYLAKDGFDESDASDDAQKIRASVGKKARKLAMEAALGDAKTGKRGGRTPFQILEEIDYENPGRDLARWREWVAGSEGRRALTWSAGLRELAKLEAEKTDAEVAAEDPQGPQVLRLAHAGWYLVRDRQPAMFDALELGGVAGLHAFLETWGAGWLPPILPGDRPNA